MTRVCIATDQFQMPFQLHHLESSFKSILSDFRVTQK